MGTLPCRDEAELKRQLEAAQRLLAEHEPTSRGPCSCGQPWPCLAADVAADHAAWVLACLASLRTPVEWLDSGSGPGWTVQP